jgi:hypothetical protein
LIISKNKTTLLLQTSSVFLRREQFTRTGVLSAALCSIPFSNAVGEKYNFPQSPQWFLECDVLEFVLVF